MARRVLVEIELPEDKSLEEILRDVRYRVVGRGSLWRKIRRVRAKHLELLGGPGSMEELRSLEEELWDSEQ